MRLRLSFPAPARVATSARWLAAVVVRSSTIAMITMAMPLTNASPMSRLCSACATGWPRPGPLIRAAIVAMDSAAMVLWFNPTTIVRRAIGSCTVRRICQRLVPIDRTASMVVGETLRMPCAVMRAIGGSA